MNTDTDIKKLSLLRYFAGELLKVYGPDGYPCYEVLEDFGLPRLDNEELSWLAEAARIRRAV